MSATFIASLFTQFVTVGLLRWRLGHGWLGRPVVLLVLVSVIYQGIEPALLAIPSVAVWDNFHLGVGQGFVDDGGLVMSLAMLAFTAGYLATRPERTGRAAGPGAVYAARRVLDWRLLACACLPLAVLTSQAHGYNNGIAAGQGTTLATDLAGTFFVVLVVLAAVACLLRVGVGWFLPVLVVQSVLLAIAGERTPVIMDAIALIVLLHFAGLRVPRRQVLAACCLTALAIVAITGVRTHQGRGLFYVNSGMSARINALAHGFSGSPQPPGGPGIVVQAAVRLSGVDFAGAVLQSISLGQPRLSPAYVPESLLLAVPSFVWPGKLDRGNALNPTELEINDFGLQQVNYIPAMPGMYVGFLPPFWLAAAFAGLGVLFGWFECWLLRACTPARMVLLAGAVAAALWYEAGLPTMLVQMRAAVAIMAAIKVVEVIRLRGTAACC